MPCPPPLQRWRAAVQRITNKHRATFKTAGDRDTLQGARDAFGVGAQGSPKYFTGAQ